MEDLKGVKLILATVAILEYTFTLLIIYIKCIMFVIASTLCVIKRCDKNDIAMSFCAVNTVSTVPQSIL